MFRFLPQSKVLLREVLNGGNDDGHCSGRQRSPVVPQSTPIGNGRSTALLPSLFLSNCNHVLNKLDELFILSSANSDRLDIICLTETWLDDSIPDTVCFLAGFNTFRKDRSTGMGGGVMCYVRDDICARRTEPIVDAKVDNDVYATSDFEVLWLILRPKVLPRPYSQLIVIVVYCPPWYEAGRKRALSKFLTAGIDFFARIHPCAIFSIVGDFNSLDTNFFY